jgi:DNA polymerase-3 subunit epsilon
LSGLDFVALDLETANSGRGSICSIGLVVVEAGEITQTHSWLCQPPEAIGHFDAFNVSLHGISAERVASEPSFYQVISTALAVIGDRPVVAHNAAFDTGAIRSACDADGLQWPTLRYGCTLVWARRELDLISYRLPMVTNELGIALERHHDAINDAEACARILLTLAGKRGSPTVDEFAAATCTRLGVLAPDSWHGCQVASSGGSDVLVAPTTNVAADPAHPLYGQVIVFTGALSMRRQDAWVAVAELGATR